MEKYFQNLSACLVFSLTRVKQKWEKIFSFTLLFEPAERAQKQKFCIANYRYRHCDDLIYFDDLQLVYRISR